MERVSVYVGCLYFTSDLCKLQLDLRSQAYQPDELEKHQHPGNDEFVHITSDTSSDRGVLRSLIAALCFGGLKLHPQYLVAYPKIYVLYSKESKHPTATISS